MSKKQEQKQLKLLLQSEDLKEDSKYAIINQIIKNMFSQKDYQNSILFLTDYINNNKGGQYNSYWLLMTAYSYLSLNAEPFAEYYFYKILKEYPDLLVDGKSIHFLCLRNLIQISKTPTKRIKYFDEMINRFPTDVNITELYYRRALEYEKDSDWEAALYSFEQYLEQPDAATIQIAGEPNAYNEARRLVDFNNSSKDWTYEKLDDLVKVIKTSINKYDWKILDKSRSKINFFSMSWAQDENDPNSQQEFSMRAYMRGQRIYYNDDIEIGATPNEAYLRTRGWSPYYPVWYLYFRKVNFPLDPEIHGNWEWAGIYMGERL